MAATVDLRALQPSDGPTVARLWRDGFYQATSVMNPLNPMRYVLFLLLKKMELEARSPWGDVGPGGQNLAKTWGGATYPSEDLSSCKLMLVAVNTASSAVIGCCGVRRGIDEQKDVLDKAETDVFTIWRLAVSKTARGCGLGRKLMQHAEEWAVQRGASKMLLYTGNPAASKFYQKLGYAKTGTFTHEKRLPST
mmetsp:Transcript_23082/g.38195  ORF Transcript_23082/g.38195 Transcript_23082/m.38195 type:complete len:194 (+) Transcript_23082:162-743(+)|eukprot:CAMPEP_0119301566 /NCGR_PEP_ID=MMETSP1333-20130426/3330_1 /TAXON_ID=418940 /ORGANISM="Scyphosphaera apsteinii, Strain RCC1455" /LENGTH=193 /DNA_ID=CAMNT_0007303683 /DNA_START=161 /DNA_END=742 /DNA_ORIENTATION=-